MDKQHLENLLFKWDKKHTDYLKSIYRANIHKPSFIQLLIDLYLTNTPSELPASWLIKHYCDAGETLTQVQVEQILNNLDALTDWGSRLHILQIIPKIQLTEHLAMQIEPEIRKLLTSDNKFVKAAAYEACFEVVQVIPAFRDEFKRICEGALASESASVKVKIKRILNKL